MDCVLLIGRGHSLAWVLPQMLSRAGFSVDVITSSPLMRRAKFVRYCDVIPLRESLLPAIRQRIGEAYTWVVVTEDETLHEILESNLPAEEKLKLLPVQREENFTHLYSKIGLSKAFAAHGINTPPSLVAHNREEALSAANQLGYPILIKLDASGGGVGVFACNSSSDLHAIKAQIFEKPLLVQKKISGFEVDLSALYLEGKLIHFSYAKVEKAFKNFGPSILRSYRPLSSVDREIFDELREVGRALGVHGFVNIGSIQSGRERFYFEADIRPNVWIESTRYFGEDPAVRIKNWFHQREVLTTPVQNLRQLQSREKGLRPFNPGKGAGSLATHMGLQRATALCRGLRSEAPSDFAGVLVQNSQPEEILIPYFLRLQWFEILINRYNVWKFIPKDDRMLTARLLIRAVMTSIAKGVIPTKYHQRVRDWLARWR